MKSPLHPHPHLEPDLAFLCFQAWDAAEICSGSARLSRCLRYGRDLKVAAVDILDWAGYVDDRPPLFGRRERNPLNILESAGMASFSKIPLKV